MWSITDWVIFSFVVFGFVAMMRNMLLDEIEEQDKMEEE